MKAAEVLQRYKANERDFRGVSLRGQNFKGKDLSDIDFSGADIRSSNFTNANLTNVNFTNAKAGLQKRWAVCLVFGSLALSVLSAFLSAFVGYLVSRIFDPSFELQIAAGASLVCVVILLLLLLFKSIVFVAEAGVVIVVIFVAGALFFTLAFVLVKAVTGVGMLAVALALTVALVLTVAVAMSSAVALAVSAVGPFGGWVAVVVAVVLTTALVGSQALAGIGTLAIALAIVLTVALVLVSADLGRRTLKNDTRNAWVRSIAIAFSAIGGTSFRGATLIDADFSQASLKSSDFRRSVLLRTHWRDAEKLDRVRAGETYLSNPKILKLLSTGNGQGQSYNQLLNLVGLNLQKVNLTKADLTGSTLKTATLQGATLTNTYLIGADLNRVNLQGADLSQAQLVQTQLDQADLTGATLTGACIEDWNVNASTKLADVTCDYVYLKSNQRERRPSQGNFRPGEFAALFQQAVNTVDLIFKDGIDWQAFFQSFQELRSQYAAQDLSIQAIERKRNGAFVVRLEVAEGADKAAIETDAKQLYESRLKLLEAKYEKQLRLQGEQHSEEIQRLIEADRREKSTLMGVLVTMAKNQGPKYDLRGAQFAGGFAETVQGNQIGGTINNQASETPSLAEAAAEIQTLLKQLEASNPTAREADQTAFLNVMIPPTKRERFIGALKAASGAAIDEVPYGSVLKALVEGWQKPEG